MPPAVALLSHMTIIELFTTFSLFYFSRNVDFSRVFFLFIKNFAGRISEAAMGGAGGSQCPALSFKDPKSTGARQKPLVKLIFLTTWEVTRHL